MAPKKGGGGGGGYGGSSSSTCDSSADYPCTDGLFKMYGYFYSQSELYGQIVLYAIWIIALLVILSQTFKTKARALQLALVLFPISFIFLCVRYGLIIAESDVPIGYRFESSVVILLQRLGMIAFIAGVFPPESSKIFKLIFYPFLGVYGVLNITYIIYDFIISNKALDQFKDDWTWRYSDRDFGLTLTPYAIDTGLIWNGDTMLSPIFAASRMFDITDEDNWDAMRGVQIKVGVAADFLALALAVFIAAIAGLSLVRKSHGFAKGAIWLIAAAAGLLLTTLFRVIVATHYVLWNWKIINDMSRWLEWVETYPYNSRTALYSDGDGSFLRGYHKTANGFPIIQALFEPLGIVIAASAIVIWWRKRRAYTAPVIETHQDNQWKGAPVQDPGLTEHYGPHYNQHYNQAYNHH